MSEAALKSQSLVLFHVKYSCGISGTWRIQSSVSSCVCVCVCVCVYIHGELVLLKIKPQALDISRWQQISTIAVFLYFTDPKTHL